MQLLNNEDKIDTKLLDRMTGNNDMFKDKFSEMYNSKRLRTKKLMIELENKKVGRKIERASSLPK